MIGKQLAADRVEFVPGISGPTEPKWIHEDLRQPKPVFSSMGGCVFSIDSLMGSTTSTENSS